MTTMNNLEKMIQLATIEHMYSMLDKLTNKQNNPNNTNNPNIIDPNIVKDNLIYKTDMRILNNHIDILVKENTHAMETIMNLSIRVGILENTLVNVKSDTSNNSKYLCQQIRGQQVLTSYPGFFTQQIGNTEEPHIKLKIEEKNEQEEEQEDYGQESDWR